MNLAAVHSLERELSLLLINEGKFFVRNDKEVRVVHIKLNRTEKILYPAVLNCGPIYHVFVTTSDDDLTNITNKIKSNVQEKPHSK